MFLMTTKAIDIASALEDWLHEGAYETLGMEGRHDVTVVSVASTDENVSFIDVCLVTGERFEIRIQNTTKGK